MLVLVAFVAMGTGWSVDHFRMRWALSHATEQLDDRKLALDAAKRALLERVLAPATVGRSVTEFPEATFLADHVITEGSEHWNRLVDVNDLVPRHERDMRCGRIVYTFAFSNAKVSEREPEEFLIVVKGGLLEKIAVNSPCY